MEDTTTTNPPDPDAPGSTSTGAPADLPNLDDIFDTSGTFADLGIENGVLKGIQTMGWVHPTMVQARLIPVALSGRDILAQSKTGTGKTAAFGLPILTLLARDPRPFASLILCPTRELAIQVAHELRELSRNTSLKVVAVYGGQRMTVQIPKLQKNPHILVGTPGRVMDLHRRGLLPYDTIKYAVLDEVDRMLDIGFRDDIRRILGSMRQQHQTILVSATIAGEIEKLARQYLDNPEKLVLTSSSLTVAQVEQHHFNVEPWDKKRLLVHLLKHEEPALTLVFCRTKLTVDGLTEYLNRKGVEAHAIHGDMYQSKRNQVMMKLRAGELSVLIASDLAARGLDVDDISHVINYDLPDDPEVYVHRIGRTARAGRKGIAWAFVTPDQGDLLTAIEKLTNAEITHDEYTDFEPGQVPRDVLARREHNAERGQEQKLNVSRVPVRPPSDVDSKNAAMYPGGKIPKGMPAKRMGGKVKTRRR